MIKLAMTSETAEILKTKLFASSPYEEGAFCLIHTGKGQNCTRLTISEIFFPESGAWEMKTTGNLRPSAKWISAMVSRAISKRSGLLFVHSHPNKAYPLGLSHADEVAFTQLAKTISPIIDGPFAAAIIHPSGWSGVVWSNDRIVPIDSITAVGRNVRMLSPLPDEKKSLIDDRQRDALGIVHDRIQNLTVAVVGCGGLGTPIAEQLVRMGVREAVLIDDDLLDTPSNVRRNIGSKMSHIETKPYRPKVHILSDFLNDIGLGVKIRPVRGDVRRENVFRQLLDCDVVINGTDTHGSRAVINELPYKYLIPVIDVGVKVGAKKDNILSGLVSEIRILTPVTPCLWCRKTINSDIIRAENLPKGERDLLIKEGYVSGSVGEPESSVIALTILGSGLATCALLALLAEEGDVAPNGYIIDGFFGDSFVANPKEPEKNCSCRRNIAYGDDSAPIFIE